MINLFKQHMGWNNLLNTQQIQVSCFSLTHLNPRLKHTGSRWLKSLMLNSMQLMFGQTNACSTHFNTNECVCLWASKPCLKLCHNDSSHIPTTCTPTLTSFCFCMILHQHPLTEHIVFNVLLQPRPKHSIRNL